MSLFGSAKEFFGLGPYNEDETYYDDPQYDDTVAGSTAYGRDRAGDRLPEREPVRGYTDAHAHHGYRDSLARDYTPAIVTAAPRGYNDAKEIGEPFRDGDVVIMDLTDLESSDAKRLVDFAAGLCFALRGKMHNLSRGMDTDRRVFAITPEASHFSASELQRAAHLR
ncbi:cell division protein SepF [Corynebacterium sp. UBA2622]|uniref:cell division protein SepF n=1 Tax=Corynebacterium sp. UBA2622 TaxID=1946393 RepID=UPI0025C52543|nr:cell division protein SepF [Corynebacterium sp. UBA2622]